MAIMLADIWPVEDGGAYKIHFARWNQHENPLEVFVRDKTEWQGWQEYWPGKNDFNRPKIFALLDFYHEQSTWLFGGIYDVLARHPDRYEVKLNDAHKDFIGRLKISYAYRDRATRVKFENHFPLFEVKELLPEAYQGRFFPGYKNVDVSFDELETIVKNSRSDWKAPLQNSKGIYLITDVSTKKRYVGAAYGEGGIWARWSDYIKTGHGDNAELRLLAKDPELHYIRQHFRFTLLEAIDMAASKEGVIIRENFWKNVLFSRADLNRN